MTQPPHTPHRPRPRKLSQAGLFPDSGNELVGTVERIRFKADDTGFSVLLVQPEGDFPPVAVVGYLSSIREGERVEFEGEWSDHPRFGRQFKATIANPVVPTTSEGIERFLASGTIKNIGPALAKRIVSLFGEDSLEVIENDPEQLLKVPGLGRKKLAEVIESWRSQSEVKEVLLFLQNYDVPLYLAEKIFRAYGPRATQILREDPYRLATDIYGIGFRTADRIAQKMGVPKDAPSRCAAGVLYVLDRLAEGEGHIFVPNGVLLNEASKILDISQDLIESAVETLHQNSRIVIESFDVSLGEDEQGLEPDGEKNRKAVYSQIFHAAECEVARCMATLTQGQRDEPRMEAALRGKGVHGDTLQDRLSAMARRSLEGGMATHDQARAIEGALAEKVLIVTGGPGTGKTTVIDAVTKLYSQLGLTILLGAPTGRAAKRLTEVTKQEARTIHRLLEFSWASGGFVRDASNPLSTDAVVIDEASMVDIHLMAHLLRAIPDTASVILVGDVDQLPSVGPGNVLRDLIDSGVVPVVRLQEVFRQAKESFIVENAHRINRGEMPREPRGAAAEDLRDYYFIEENDAERCADILIELCRERIRERFGLDPINDVQVISPMQRGSLGVQSLNVRLQEALNPPSEAPSIQSGGRTFRQGDKLIQIRNNYEKNVFNGDIGVIRNIDPSAGSLSVAYDSGTVEYTKDSLDEVFHAYVITVHKSQGSEYPAVVIPLHTQHYPMLQRNLVYTALTRAKRLAVFIGSKKALAIAIKNAKVRRRWSHLAERIRKFAGLSSSPKELGENTLTPATTGNEIPSPWDERPPDFVYESEGRDDDDIPPLPGELTYHPIND